MGVSRGPLVCLGREVAQELPSVLPSLKIPGEGVALASSKHYWMSQVSGSSAQGSRLVGKARAGELSKRKQRGAAGKEEGNRHSQSVTGDQISGVRSWSSPLRHSACAAGRASCERVTDRPGRCLRVGRQIICSGVDSLSSVPSQGLHRSSLLPLLPGVQLTVSFSSSRLGSTVWAELRARASSFPRSF